MVHKLILNRIYKSLQTMLILTTCTTCLLSKAHASPPEKSELIIGVMQHDLGAGFKQRHERGQNVIFEYAFSNKYDFLNGVPHIGATINNRGYTSAMYIGLTWRLNLPADLFIDLTFGGGINNAEKKTPKKRQAVGSNLLFRESLSIGKHIGDYTISIMVDHMSNARLAPPNPGLTDFGMRVGYKL